MHDILRERLMRKIESLPEEQVYQMLDYIEFLEAKYGSGADEETSGIRRFAEAMEDKLRKTSVSPAKLREAFQLLSAADRVLSNVSSAGRKLIEELTPVSDEDAGKREQFFLHTQLRNHPPLSCSPDAAFLLSLCGHRKVFYLEQDLATSSPRQIAARKMPGYRELARRQGHRKSDTWSGQLRKCGKL